MIRTTLFALGLATAAITAAQTATAANPVVGGAEMLASKTIVENAMNSADHTTLVAALKAAGLVETLQGPGPFTVFAPTDAAFAALPEGTVGMLMQPGNKDRLARILACHVVGAEAMAEAIGAMIDADGGAHPVATLGGCRLTARRQGDRITLEDETGSLATVTQSDVGQSNGVIHVIDAVLLPKM